MVSAAASTTTSSRTDVSSATSTIRSTDTANGNGNGSSGTTNIDETARKAPARPRVAPNTSTAATANAHAHGATHASLFAMLWPCALYLCCAFAMNMLTKIVLTTYEWKALYALGAAQNTFTMMSVSALVGVQRLWQRYLDRSRSNRSSTHTASVSPRSSHKLPTLSYVLKVMLPLVTLHVGNMILGFASMRVVNMPMYLVLRRLTTLKVMLIEWLVLRKDMSTGVKLALLLSTFGSVVAGSTDVTADATGYVLVLLQNMCSALSLTFSKESALSSIELVLLNSVAGSAICSVLAFHLERDAVLAFPHLFDPQFLLVAGVMCCVCVLYQFSIFICTLRNSALATSVTGNIKDLVSTVCGFALFSDAPVRVINLVGVALSFLGAYSFSYLKYLAFAAQAAAAARHAKPKQT